MPIENQPPNPEPSQESSIEDELQKAEALLKKAREEKEQACIAEIKQVLEKHGMIMRVTTPQIIIEQEK